MVVHGAYPLDPRVAREARAASAAGYEVDVVCLRESGESAFELVDGVRVSRLPVRHSHGAGGAGVLKEYLGFTLLACARVGRLAARRRYDVVQVHNPPDFLIAAALLPRMLGARIVFDIHDLSPDMFEMRFGERRGARAADRVLRLVERLSCRFADAVITVHEPYRRELVRRGVPERKTEVVMNTLDESLLPPELPGTEEGAFRVVYHGTITPHYGVDLLVEAFAALAREVPDATLEIYGGGDYVSVVEARTRELGVDHRVTLPERMLSQREVLGRIRGAAVGVVPNRPTQLNRFALSSKLFEYVALGIPAVCAELPTLRGHFSPADVLFFEAGDATSLARALLDVARKPREARQRADSARRTYEAYRWPLNARRYLALLDRLARRPSPSERNGQTAAQ